MQFIDNIVLALRHCAQAYPDRAALIHLGNGILESDRISYGQLTERVCRLAALLQAEGLAGAPVIVATAAGPEYAIGVLSCFFAGAIAVPMPEIVVGRPSQRWDGVLRQLSPAAVICSPRAREAATGQDLRVPLWLTVDESCPDTLYWQAPILSDAAPAFVQFTSGSTGSPKGAIVTHGALAANRAMIRSACDLEPAVHTVTWLPPWHDMGLVGALLHHLGDGLSVVSIPPLVAVQRPIRWLRAIQTYGATISGGPASSFRTCIDRTTAAEREGLDLSSWRLAYCGAEPIPAQGLRDFARVFQPHGFDAQAFAPCYGLAEATLFATGIKRGVVRVIEVDRDALNADAAIVPAQGGRQLVSCGRPQGDGSLEIIDPVTGAELPSGQVGEIAISGPHLARGYWLPEQDDGTFEMTEGRRRLRTGDMGAVLDGDLFVTGRLNHRIIVRGKKHHAEDLESEALAADPILAGGSAVVFEANGSEREQTIMVVEVPRANVAELPVAKVVSAVRAVVVRQCGVWLDEVILVRAGSLPRTTSGKVERHNCSASYAVGGWPANPLTEAGTP